MLNEDLVTKSRLRQLREPIHLFGETPDQRFERLATLLEQYAIKHGQHYVFKQYPLTGSWKQTAKSTTPALTTEDLHLINCRRKILRTALILAAHRQKNQKQKMQEADAIELEERFDRKALGSTTYQMVATQFGDISNVMKANFSIDERWLVTAGGSSEARIWSIPEAVQKSKLCGHRGRLHDVVFHPLAGAIPKGAPNIATASSDMEVKLWTFDPNLQFQKSISLKEHTDRVNRICFHNTGDYLFSASYDETWTFWDLTRAKKLYRQTGHNQPIYSLSTHPDGSLIFTGDTKGRGMVWDLRTGKSVLPIIGHKDGILGSDFASNGYVIATCSQDNTVRVWDIRRRNCLYVLPAHTKIVSDVKFNKQATLLMSVSHDNCFKLWHGKDYTLLKNYKAHDSKISSLAVSQKYVATTTLDRKWSLWQPIQMTLEEQNEGLQKLQADRNDSSESEQP